MLTNEQVTRPISVNIAHSAHNVNIAVIYLAVYSPGDKCDLRRVSPGMSDDGEPPSDLYLCC